MFTVKDIEEIFKDYVPYIEYIGNGLYRINGDNNFYYITNEAGAKEAVKALRDLVNEKYGLRK